MSRNIALKKIGGQENKQEKVRSIFDDRPANPISVRPRIFNNTDDTITRMKQREEDRKINDAYYKYAPAIAALYASKKALENQRIQAFVRGNISLSYLQDSIKSLEQMQLMYMVYVLMLLIPQ